MLRKFFSSASSRGIIDALPQINGRRQSRRWIRSKTGAIGVVFITIIGAIAILAPYLAPHSPYAPNLSLRMLPPMWLSGGMPEYPLGTDYLGRDLLSRIIYGARISLIVGICSVAVAGTIGMVLGLIAGYYGGWVDSVIMRVIDALLAIPGILLIMLIMAIVGPGVVTLIFVIGVTGWESYARVVRSEVLSVKERDFVKAAKAVGAKDVRILMHHILPNVASSFIVMAALSVSGIIIAESSLSFLGLGIQPPTVSWGGMLSDGKAYLATSWWLSVFPGIAITLTTLSVTFCGDWLRDVMDPRTSEGNRL